MFCNKCGKEIEDNSKFCGGCGNSILNGDTNNIEPDEIKKNNNNNNMKKYAILGVAIPTVSIVIYWFVGLSYVLSLLIAGLGFRFVRQGKSYNKGLTVLGFVLNILLILMGTAMSYLLKRTY